MKNKYLFFDFTQLMQYNIFMKHSLIKSIICFILFSVILSSCSIFYSHTISNVSGWDVTVIVDGVEAFIPSQNEASFENKNGITFSFTASSIYAKIRLEECNGDYCFFDDIDGIYSGTHEDAVHVSSFTVTSSSNTGGSYNPTGASVQCRAYTQEGTRCKRKTTNKNGYCWQHQP